MCVSVKVIGVSVEGAVVSVPPPSFAKWTSPAEPLAQASQRTWACVASPASPRGPLLTKGAGQGPAPPLPPLPPLPPAAPLPPVPVVVEPPLPLVVEVSLLEH